MTDLRGKTVAITGASSGIGASMAELFARQGARLALIARDPGKLEAVRSRLGPEHLAMACDVTDEARVNETVAAIMESFGRIDVWINNAGFGLFKPLSEMTMEEVRRMTEVNYLATVRCTMTVLPHMLRAGSGSIVNIASVAGKVGTAKAAAYSASKFAVVGFTQSLRMELAGTGVSVSAVNPGPVDTPFFDIADPEGYYKRSVAMFMMKPERVARAALKAVRTGRGDLTLPLGLSLGAKLLQLFPNALEGVARRLLSRK